MTRAVFTTPVISALPAFLLFARFSPKPPSHPRKKNDAWYVYDGPDDTAVQMRRLFAIPKDGGAGATPPTPPE